MGASNPDALRGLLTAPAIPDNFPPGLLYRAATIGAIRLLADAIGAEKDKAGRAGSLSAPDTQARDAGPDEEPDAMSSSVAVDILITAVLQSPAAEIRSAALDALVSAAKVSHPDAIEAIFALAVHHQNQAALAVLSRYDFQHSHPEWNSLKYFLLKKKEALAAADPDLSALTRQFIRADAALRQTLIRVGRETHPNWARIAGFFHALLQNEFPDSSLFGENEKMLFAETLLAAFPERGSILADLFLEIGDPVSRRICLKRHLIPENPEKTALFFFLSEQWPQYENQDLDYRQIKTAFTAADNSLKRRLIEVSRKSGHTAWMRALDTTAQFRENQAMLSFSQWAALIRLLGQNRNFHRLWEILPVAPAWYAPEIHSALSAGGFSPAAEEENAFFRQIGTLCAAIPEQIPLPLSRRFYTEKTKPVQLCLSPDGERLAAVFLNDSVQIWNVRDRRIPPTILTEANNGFRAVAFSNSGDHLAAIAYDHSIQIFQIPSAKMIKRLPPQRTPIAALCVSQDDKKMISLHNDGSGNLWGFPHGTAIQPFDTGLKDVLRSAYDACQERLILLSRDGTLAIFDPEKNQITDAFPTEPKGLLIGQSNPEELLTCVSADNFLSCWNLISQRPLIAAVLPDIQGRILSAWDIQPGEITALGTQSGHCGLVELASGRKLAETPIGENQAAVTALQADAARTALFSADMSGRIASWDLTLFRWMTGTFKISEMPSLKNLEDFIAGSTTRPAANAAALMKALVEWRSRFDIEIEFEL